jgi:cell division protein FtsX
MNNDVVSKIKNSNRDIENLALGFVTIIVLIFLLVIFNTIRNNNKK